MLVNGLPEAPTEERHEEVLMRVRGLRKHFVSSSGFFNRSSQRVRAVDGVDIDLDRGETLGLVGESGCGKTTTGRMLVRLEDPTDGAILLGNRNYTTLTSRGLREYRRRVQMVFQDPMASLDPRMTIGDSIAEPLIVQRICTRREARQRILTLLEQVGLPLEMADRYPHQVSGGQRQRVCIARALSLEPEVIVLDEPTSALDVSVRAQVINLLKDLQARLGISFIFISHDLSTVRHISDRVSVMYLGKIVEHGESEDIFDRPMHPYTRALLSAIPSPDPSAEQGKTVLLLQGDLPSPANPPSGCHFRTRCPLATDMCAAEQPQLREYGNGHKVACHYAGQAESSG